MVYPDSKYTDPLARGQLFEDFVSYMLLCYLGRKVTIYRTKREQYEVGESAEGYEIKEDTYCTQTRRLSIEIGEKTHLRQHSFVPSGIRRSDNTVWYAQGNYQCIWLFSKQVLRELYESGDYPIVSEDPPTIQKFYLPLVEATRRATHVLRVATYVCQYGLTPCPSYDSCLPCSLYQGGHCTSRGAVLCRKILAATSKEVPHDH